MDNYTLIYNLGSILAKYRELLYERRRTGGPKGTITARQRSYLIDRLQELIDEVEKV